MDVFNWTKNLRILNHLILLTLLILLMVAILVDHGNVCREYFHFTENQKITRFTKNHQKRKFYKRYENELWDPKAGFIEELEKCVHNIQDTTVQELPGLFINE